MQEKDNYSLKEGSVKKLEDFLNDNEQESKSHQSPKNRTTIKRKHKKLRRNEACPCGSNKKFKNCCGR